MRDEPMTWGRHPRGERVAVWAATIAGCLAVVVWVVLMVTALLGWL